MALRQPLAKNILSFLLKVIKNYLTAALAAQGFANIYLLSNYVRLPQYSLDVIDENLLAEEQRVGAATGPDDSI